MLERYCSNKYRDVKLANILVNNLHYCNASQEDAIDLFRKNPLTCKLADLGEARYKIIQTRVLTENTRIVRLCRGSPAYMAPEMSIDKVMKSASIEQLEAVDVWAFALTSFTIINLDQDYPYQMNIELLKKEKDETDLLALRKKCLTSNAYPIFSIKYEVIQATQYPHIREMVLDSIKFDWQDRQTINDIFKGKNNSLLSIISLPVNCFIIRLARLYDTYEAYEILCSNNLLHNKFEFQEYLVENEATYSVGLQREIMKGIDNMKNSAKELNSPIGCIFHFSIYIFSLLVFLINEIIIIDSHPISQEIGEMVI